MVALKFWRLKQCLILYHGVLWFNFGIGRILRPQTTIRYDTVAFWFNWRSLEGIGPGMDWSVGTGLLGTLSAALKPFSGAPMVRDAICLARGLLGRAILWSLLLLVTFGQGLHRSVLPWILLLHVFDEVSQVLHWNSRPLRRHACNATWNLVTDWHDVSHGLNNKYNWLFGY